MKTLYIVRHAQAQWHEQSDFERQLSPQGIADATVMAQRFSQHKTPDSWISSTAPRALTTASLFANASNLDHNKIQLSDAIYEAHYEVLLHTLRQVSEHSNSVVLFGHNPGVSNLCYFLSTSAVSFGTCYIATLESNIEHWKDLGQGSCQLLGLHGPGE